MRQHYMSGAWRSGWAKSRRVWPGLFAFRGKEHIGPDRSVCLAFPLRWSQERQHIPDIPVARKAGTAKGEG